MLYNKLMMYIVYNEACKYCNFHNIWSSHRYLKIQLGKYYSKDLKFFNNRDLQLDSIAFEMTKN